MGQRDQRVDFAAAPASSVVVVHPPHYHLHYHHYDFVGRLRCPTPPDRMAWDEVGRVDTTQDTH